MDGKMKILIAYDGSTCAKAALDDLMRAGLPREAEAIIISVTEPWLESALPGCEVVKAAFPSYISVGVKAAPAPVASPVETARELALEACTRVQTSFPAWDVRAEAHGGSPAREIIKKADEWQPDLIVVGAQGCSHLGRFLLGSVSQKVLTEARTSVRVARASAGGDFSPVRIIIGVDGSLGAEAAVSAVAARAWPPGSEARVIAVDDAGDPTLISRIAQPVAKWAAEHDKKAERAWVGKMIDEAVGKLLTAELTASSLIEEGDPKRVLVQEAEEWGADTIFVGSTGSSNRLQRFLLGSVSAAVVARASCSVEVVRQNTYGARHG
jgi:nucleotide-binding universal stress UspA family protein